MGAFAAGQVVLVRFPFSDLTRSKLRPAVVLANVGRNDWVLCQVTSKPYADSRITHHVEIPACAAKPRRAHQESAGTARRLL
jgi:mRNA interferase MazF